MAIVANKAGTTPIDPPLCTHNRSNAGEPNGALTPAFVGEIVLDTTNNRRWKARTLLNSGWTPIDATG